MTQNAPSQQWNLNTGKNSTEARTNTKLETERQSEPIRQEKKEVLRGAAPQDQVTVEKSRSGSSDANPALSRTATQDH